MEYKKKTWLPPDRVYQTFPGLLVAKKVFRFVQFQAKLPYPLTVCPDLGSKWVRLDSNGTNEETFQISFQYIFWITEPSLCYRPLLELSNNMNSSPQQWNHISGALKSRLCSRAIKVSRVMPPCLLHYYRSYAPLFTTLLQAFVFSITQN